MTSSERFAQYLIGPASVALAVIAYVFIDLPYVGAIAAGVLAAIGFASIFTYQSPEEDDVADELFFSALTEMRPISIALADQRVIVGYIMEMRPRFGSPWLKILPLMAGHASEGPGGIILNTFYDEVLKKLAAQADHLSENQLEELSIIINKRELLSAQRFNFEIYSQLVGKDDLSRAILENVIDFEQVRNLLLSQRESKRVATG